MELKRFSLFAAAAFFAAAAIFADADHGDYVQLTRQDTGSSSSWNEIGGWSDGAAPEASKNYYVAPGALLWRKADTNEQSRAWNGGQLVVAGTFHSSVSGGDIYAPFIENLVLLGGSTVRAEAYGPFGPYNGMTSTVTVVSTVENPVTISHNYSKSRTSNGSVRNHSLVARFMGDEGSCLTYTRPYVNFRNEACDHGFFCWLTQDTLADYRGTFRVTGGNTVVKPIQRMPYNFPNAAIKVDDGAEFHFFNGNAPGSSANEYVDMRSFAADGASLYFNYASSSRTVFPVIRAAESFSLGGASTINVASTAAKFDTFVVGISPDNPQGLAMKLAELPEGASVAVNAAEKIDMMLASGANLRDIGVSLVTVDNESGGKDIWFAAPGIVTMTNDNVETTGYAAGFSPAGTPQYGAFEPGHGADWSNGETPSSDSTLHYFSKRKLCFFMSTELRNAELTIGGNGSWKGGSELSFRKVNILPGARFGLWGNDRNRRWTAESFNVVDFRDGNPSTLYAGSNIHLDLNAGLCGSGHLLLRNFADQNVSFALTHDNSAFHGRLTIMQESSSTVPYLFCAYLHEASNFGGAYSGTNTYCAITLSNNPKVIVTNDVDFAEQTRGMLIDIGAEIEVASNRTMRLANQVTWNGVLVKTGDGVLDLAGTSRFVDGEADTAPVAGSNRVVVSAGTLKVSSESAAEGLSVSFAEGTRLVVGAGFGYRNVLSDSPLAVDTKDGTLPVEIAMEGDESASTMDVPICTFSAEAAAQISATAFRVGKTSNRYWCKSMAKRINGDGTVSYVATMAHFGGGTQVIVR